MAHQYRNINIIGTIQNTLPQKNPIMINNKPLPEISKKDLPSMNYDLILVVGQDASLVPILKESKELQIDPDKVILDRTICLPGFTFDRYKKLRNSQLSILSINCWGGLVYHTLGLQFLSPTINMFTSGNDFMKFLHNPRYYMEKELRYYKMNYEINLKEDYPVFILNDIQLHMNHYGKLGVDGARQKWEERRLKINWYNLLIMMFTESPEILKKFDELPYAKKVCFVPFETDLYSGYYIDSKFSKGKNKEFYQAVNETALGIVRCFDIFDILLYGKKTPI